MPEAGFMKADLYRLGRALMLAGGTMNARGRVYEDGPPLLWTAR